MKMNKKAVAILLTAVLTAGAAVAGNSTIPAQADEQQSIPTGQFALPDIPLKEGGSAELEFPEYEKAVGFMYSSTNTKAVVVDGTGALEPGSNVITGEAVVEVKVLYNFTEVNKKEYQLKLEKDNDRFYITDMEGNEITSVEESGIRYELTVEDESVASATLDGKKITVKGVKAGETTMTLTGYAGTMAFGSGSCKITIAANGAAKPQDPTTPPASEEPVTTPPAVSEEPATPPAVSEEPVVPSTPEPQQRLSGDADGNGKIELADAQQVLKAALKIATIEDESIIKAVDMDGNNKIELADAQHILKKALKIIE